MILRPLTLQAPREVTVLEKKLTRCQELLRKLAESELGVQLSSENAQEYLEAKLELAATPEDLWVPLPQAKWNPFLESVWAGYCGASQEQGNFIPVVSRSSYVADCSGGQAPGLLHA